MVFQQADIIWWKTSTFIVPSKMAGVEVMAKFSTTDATAKKSLKSWTMCWTWKCTLKDTFGNNVVGTIGSLQQEVQEHSFDYGYGSAGTSL